MERMGITPDMLKMAEEVGLELERAMGGLNTSQKSLENLLEIFETQKNAKVDKSKMDIVETAQRSLQAS
eukprot:11860253-Ditylum_brightwellii.AAC.1